MSVEEIDEFNIKLDEIEEYIKSLNGQKYIFLMEGKDNFVSTIYATITLRYYHQNGYHVILLLDKKYSYLYKDNSDLDKIFDFNFSEYDSRFLFFYRKILIARNPEWLAPHPAFGRDWMEMLPITTPIILNQYLMNSKVPIDVDRSFKCCKPSVEDEKKIDGLTRGLDLKRSVVLEDTTWHDLQRMINLLNVFKINVISFNKGLDSVLNFLNLSRMERVAFLNRIPLIVGGVGETTILSMVCDNKPIVCEVGACDYSSLKAVYNYQKVVTVPVSRNHELKGRAFIAVEELIRKTFGMAPRPKKKYPFKVWLFKGDGTSRLLEDAGW